MAAEQQPQRLYATQEAQLAELLSQIPIPIARLLELAEDVELQALSARPEDLTRDLQSVVPFLAVEFLSYYAEGDENNARFLWKRLPSRLKSVEELKALWAVGQGLYLRNYPQLHRAFDAASEVATDKVYAGLLQVAHQNVRARLVELIARAYENISIDDAGAYLGLDAVQLSTKCQELGWELRDSFIYPIRETRTQQQQDDLLKNVESLVQHEVFLELV